MTHPIRFEFNRYNKVYKHVSVCVIKEINIDRKGQNFVSY